MVKKSNKIFKWIELPCPQDLIIGGKAFQRGNLRVLVSRDLGRWHISISRPDRYPTWEEIKLARDKFIPQEAFMVQCLPPPQYFLNVHENCFHLWETRDETLIEIMRGM